MEIRTNSKYYNKFIKINTIIKNLIITLDEKAIIPVIMVKFENGELKEYLKGFKNIKNFLKFGYNKIIKKCPIRHRKCIGVKCQLYWIENSTGDCSINWFNVKIGKLKL